MGQFKITASQAKRRFPGAYSECLDKVSKSNNKQKASSPVDWKWYIEWGEVITGAAMTFDEMFNSLGTPPKVDTRTVDEKIKDRIDRSFASIRCIVGGHGYSSSQLQDVPDEVVETITDTEREQEIEQQRVDKMTDAEREAEIQDLLEQLRGPGFFGVRIGQ